MATPPFDWQDRRTWSSAVDGVRAVYISFQPDLAVPGAPETVGAFVRTGRAGRRPALGATFWPR